MANLHFSMSAIAQDTVDTTLVQEPEGLPPIPLPTTPEPVMIPSSGGSGRFGQPGPADRVRLNEPKYLSGSAPFFERFREALDYDQPTWQRYPLTGSGRFGQANALDYGDIEEGPGFVDVLFPERSRSIRERVKSWDEDTGDAPPEEPLPPTLLTRLNKLFLNQVLADATLPFSIRNPGPDSANFPNSAYTLERGHVYIETQPVQVSGPTNMNASAYSWGYLLRFGLTDRVEFRLLSNGFTHQSAYEGNKQSGTGPQQAVSGWSPLGVDFKVNFWEQRIRSLVPAMGAELTLFTDTGSNYFQNGVAVAVNLLFDYNFGNGWNFEWNFGLQPSAFSETTANYDYIQQFTAQWSLQKAVTDDFSIYVQGYYGDSAAPRYGGSTVVGAGALYYIGKKWSVWGDYNVGLVKEIGPPYVYALGFAYAL